MSTGESHFVLFSRCKVATGKVEESDSQWYFRLESRDGQTNLEAEDIEPGMPSDRLELLAIVRGLEALDFPSEVTIVSSSRYVCQGLRFGLEEWLECDWQWERFGEMVPIKNCDLWKRVHQAMQFHQVQCRPCSAEEGEAIYASPRLRKGVRPAEEARDVAISATSAAPSPLPAFGGRMIRVDGPHATPAPKLEPVPSGSAANITQVSSHKLPRKRLTAQPGQWIAAAKKLNSRVHDRLAAKAG